MSPYLREALQEWLEDATSEDPCNTVRHCGICAWMWRYPVEVGDEYKSLLYDDFGDNSSTPFHASYYAYLDDKDAETQHLNPERLAWVRSKLEN